MGVLFRIILVFDPLTGSGGGGVGLVGFPKGWVGTTPRMSYRPNGCVAGCGVRCWLGVEPDSLLQGGGGSRNATLACI